MKGSALQAVPRRNELMNGETAATQVEINRLCPPSNSMRPSARKINHMRVIREYKQSLSERDLYYCVSDLIDGHIDFDQWEFCVVWATRIAFLPVLPAISPFINFFSLVTSRSRERFQNESVHLHCVCQCCPCISSTADKLQ